MTPERIAEIKALGGAPDFDGHYSNEDGMHDSCGVFYNKPCDCSFADVRSILDELLTEIERLCQELPTYEITRTNGHTTIRRVE